MLQVVAVLKVTRNPMAPRIEVDPDTGSALWARGGFTGDGKLYYGSKAIEAVKAGDTSGLVESIDYRAVTDFTAFHFVGGASSDEVLDTVRRLRRGFVIWALLEVNYAVVRGQTYKSDQADLVDLIIIEATPEDRQNRVSLMPPARERIAAGKS